MRIQIRLKVFLITNILSFSTFDNLILMLLLHVPVSKFILLNLTLTLRDYMNI